MSATIKTLSDLKATARQLVGREEYDTVFDLLDDALLKDAALKTDLLAQQAKLNRTRRNQERGTITRQDAEAAFTQVVYAVETLLKELEQKDLRTDVFPIAMPALSSPSTAQSPDAISALEKEGLQNEATLLQRKLNSLNQARVTAYDAAQKFALEEQISAIKMQLDSIKQKLG